MMAGPEDLEQISVRNLRRVIIHLHGFGVIAEVSIGGVWLGASFITHPGAHHPF